MNKLRLTIVVCIADGMNTKSKKSRFLLKRRAVSTNVIDCTLSPTSPNNSYPPKSKS